MSLQTAIEAYGNKLVGLGGGGGSSDTPESITWTAYQALSEQEREGHHYLISGYPASGIMAEDVGYDNTTSGLTSDDVNGAIDEIAKPAFTEASTRENISSGESIKTIFGKIKKWFSDLSSMFVSKSGDTMTGDIIIDNGSASTSQGGSRLTLGNDTPVGTVGNSRGVLYLYGKGQYYGRFFDNHNNGLTGNRTYNLPDASGTLALDTDVYRAYTKEKIGSIRISDGTTITLSKTPSNFQFIFITVGYYDSGYPSYGSKLLPVALWSGIEAVCIICYDSAISKIIVNTFANNTTSIKFSVTGTLSSDRYVAVWGIK